MSWGSTRDLLAALRNQHRSLAMDVAGLESPAVAGAGVSARAGAGAGVGAGAGAGTNVGEVPGAAGGLTVDTADGTRRASIGGHYDQMTPGARRWSSLLKGSELAQHVPQLASVTQQLLWDAEREAKGERSNDALDDDDNSDDSEEDQAATARRAARVAAAKTHVQGGRRKSAVDRLNDLASILMAASVSAPHPASHPVTLAPATCSHPSAHCCQQPVKARMVKHAVSNAQTAPVDLVSELQKWSDSYRCVGAAVLHGCAASDRAERPPPELLQGRQRGRHDRVPRHGDGQGHSRRAGRQGWGGGPSVQPHGRRDAVAGTPLSCRASSSGLPRVRQGCTG